MNNLVSVEVKQQLGSITSNLDKVEQSIKESLEAYKNFVVTEDTIAASKSAVAELRKGKAELDASRKAIKNSWNVPYLEFEKRAKIDIEMLEEDLGIEFDVKGKFKELMERHKKK